MSELQKNEQLKEELIRSLEFEKYALKQLKYKEEELLLTKKRLRLYENRWNKLMNFLPVKILIYFKNKIKG